MKAIAGSFSHKSITLKETVMELRSLKSFKIVKILYENMEGFLRKGIIILTM